MNTQTPSTATLALQAVTHRHGIQTVLEQVSLTVHAGEAVALVGPSGCGKTTLLHLAAGLQLPWEGQVHNGFARTGVMFQQPRLLPWLTTQANVALGLKARGVPKAQREHRAGSLALEMGLTPQDLAKHPNALSGGMQSRAALARAFAIAPDLLLLDEAFTALDIGLKAELYRLLLRQRQAHGTAVLMVTHDLMEAVRLADCIVVLTGAPGRVCTRHRLHTPAAERDDAWVHRQTAAFLADPLVRQAFGLPDLPGLPDWPPCATQPSGDPLATPAQKM